MSCDHVVGPHVKGSGNLLLDMEQQMQANRIRITVLEQENSTLLNSLTRLRARVHANGSRVGLLQAVLEIRLDYLKLC